MKNIPDREMKIRQSQNGIIVTEVRSESFGHNEWVFSDMKDLKAFIGKNFIDAKGAEKLKLKEAAAEEKRKKEGNIKIVIPR